MRTIRFLLFLALPALLLACGQASGPATDFQSPLAKPTTAASPTPPAQSAPLTPAPVTSPQPGTGGATGQIVDHLTGQPVIDRALFLGSWSTLTSREGEESPYVIMLPSTSPQAAVNAEGSFRFSNVKPGDYALVLWTPMRSSVATDPKTEQAYVVTIEADQVTDLGTLVVDSRR